MFSAFIIDWTMDEYAELKRELTEARFVFEQEGETGHIRVVVPYEHVETFGALCQKHLNSPANYVDIQYPEHKMTVIIFQDAMHRITSRKENDEVKTWAIEQGLPPAQAEWGTSYEQ